MKYKKYKIADNIMEEIIEDEILLMNSKSQFFYKLSGTSAFLWSVIKEFDNTKDVYLEMRDVFCDVSDEQLKKDIASFFDDITKKEIVTLYE